MKTYEEFRDAVRDRESSDNYACVNQFGFLGAYQFGLARLCDLGITRRKQAASGSIANSNFEFIPPRSEESFLADSSLQDECFDRHVQLLKHQVRKVYQGGNLSGAIAACHLLGMGAFKLFLDKNVDLSDALGTSIRDYFDSFEGFEIP